MIPRKPPFTLPPTVTPPPERWRWDDVTLETVIFPGKERIIEILPNGWVLAINVKRRNIDDPMPLAGGIDHRARFTVHRDPSMHEAVGDFIWGIPRTDCGIAFKTPIANLNSTCPLLLLRNAPLQCPDLLVTIISLTEK